MATLTIRDESTTGDRSNSSTLEFLTEQITIRDLIRERVYQEVKDHNTGVSAQLMPLVQLSQSAGQQREIEQIEWKPQFERACAAFQQQKVLVLVNERQAASLDEVVTIQPDTEVVFLKLMPLIGG